MAPADKQPEQQQDAAAPADLKRASSKRDQPETVEGAEVQGREQALRRDKPPSFKVGDGGVEQELHAPRRLPPPADPPPEAGSAEPKLLLCPRAPAGLIGDKGGAAEAWVPTQQPSCQVPHSLTLMPPSTAASPHSLLSSLACPPVCAGDGAHGVGYEALLLQPQPHVHLWQEDHIH